MALQLNEETFDGVRRPIARLADTVPDGTIALSGSPDGATALVTVASNAGDHERVWVVDLASGEVRDLAAALASQPGVACGPRRERGGGLHERGPWVHGSYRGDGRRLMFPCARHLFDAREEDRGLLASSLHEYDLDAGRWNTVARGCDFGGYSREDACTTVVSHVVCPSTFISFSAIVDDEPRAVPPEVYDGVESLWLARGGGYLVTRRDGAVETLHRLAPDGSALGVLLRGENLVVWGQSPDGAFATVSMGGEGWRAVVWIDLETGRELRRATGSAVVATSPDGASVVATEITAPYGSFLLNVDGTSRRMPTAFASWQMWLDATYDPSGEYVLPRGAPYTLVTRDGELVRDFGEERMERTPGESYPHWRDAEILALAFRVARP